MTELPLVIVDIQRGGPSTGLPTKTEQADLLQAMFGRNGESPIAIIAPQTPADCFGTAYEAVRMAVHAMAPVMILSDGYIGNGSEPWLIPDDVQFPPIHIEHPTSPEGYQPYKRDPETLARPWAIPGTPGLEHRIGGIEKQDITGNISYDPANHQQMVINRAEKIQRLQNFIPDQEIFGDKEGKLLILGWGSTFGSIRSAVERLRSEGRSVSHAHLRYLNPFPKNLKSVMDGFDRVLIPEINMGQLAFLIKGTFCRPIDQLNYTRGTPIKIREVYEKALELLGGK